MFSMISRADSDVFNVKKSPQLVRPHFNLGIALKEQGLIHDAIEHYEEALRIKPDYVDARNNLGLALIDRGNIDGAIEQFRKVLQIDPKHVIAKNNLKKALELKK